MEDDGDIVTPTMLILVATIGLAILIGIVWYSVSC